MQDSEPDLGVGVQEARPHHSALAAPTFAWYCKNENICLATK